MSQLYKVTKSIPEMGFKKGQVVGISDIENHPHKASLALYDPNKPKSTAKNKAEAVENAN